MATKLVKVSELKMADRKRETEEWNLNPSGTEAPQRSSSASTEAA